MNAVVIDFICCKLGNELSVLPPAIWYKETERTIFKVFGPQKVLKCCFELSKKPPLTIQLSFYNQQGQLQDLIHVHLLTIYFACWAWTTKMEPMGVLGKVIVFENEALWRKLPSNEANMRPYLKMTCSKLTSINGCFGKVTVFYKIDWLVSP